MINNIISRRFKELRIKIKDEHGKEIPITSFALKLITTNCIKDYDVEPIRQEISKVEKNGKFPQSYLIEGYCKYFNVTSDYLLGIRNNAVVDENIAMIGKTTGLNDEAILKLKSASQNEKLILNALINTDSLHLLELAASNYYRSNFYTMRLCGMGETIELDNEESEKFFQMFSKECLQDMFNRIIHDKAITNTFMKGAVNDLHDSFVNTIMKSSQTEKFKTGVLSRIEEMKTENTKTDYYSKFTKDGD